MRILFYLGSLTLVIAFAFGSYRIKYDTRDKLAAIEALRAEIGRERENIVVLQAEWAVLNAPERLAELVDRYQAELGLGPMTAAQFGSVADIAARPVDEEDERRLIEDLIASVTGPESGPERGPESGR